MRAMLQQSKNHVFVTFDQLVLIKEVDSFGVQKPKLPFGNLHTNHLYNTKHCEFA